MLTQATLDVAPREKEIAAQKMRARLLGREPFRDGFRLSPLQIGERPLELIGHPLHCCEPNHARHRSAPLSAAASAASYAGFADDMSPRSCRISPWKHAKANRSARARASAKPRSTKRCASS